MLFTDSQRKACALRVSWSDLVVAVTHTASGSLGRAPVCAQPLCVADVQCHVMLCCAAVCSLPCTAGAPRVNPANYTQPNGFLPFGMGGVVKAASSVFFA
jgi:hypothetical protein